MTKSLASPRRRLVRSGLAALAAAWIASEAVPALSGCLLPAAAEPTSTAVAAAFTGDFDRGAPIYRLPPVTVRAGRTVVAQTTAASKREPVEPRAIRSPAARPAS